MRSHDRKELQRLLTKLSLYDLRIRWHEFWMSHHLTSLRTGGADLDGQMASLALYDKHRYKRDNLVREQFSLADYIHSRGFDLIR